MKTVEIKAQKRADVGKNKVDKLRNNSKVPAIMYGTESLPLMISDHDAKILYNLRHENFLVKLMLEDQKTKEVLIKDIQLNPVKNNVIHIDFMELIQDKPIRVKVPVELEGTPAGLKMGGITQHFLWELTVECLPKNIPEHIKVDVSPLEIGDSIHVRDIKVGAHVKIIDKAEQVVITIGLPTGVIEERAAAAAAAAEAAAAAAAAAEAGIVPGEEGAEGVAAEGAPAEAGAKPGAAPVPGAKPGVVPPGAKPGTPAEKGKEAKPEAGQPAKGKPAPGKK